MTKKYSHHLKSFEDVSQLLEPKPSVSVAKALTRKRKKKSNGGSQETDLNVSSISLPCHADYETKIERLAMLTDTITSIDNSDVVVLALWVVHPEAHATPDVQAP
jgi:hypothetical protein